MKHFLTLALISAVPGIAHAGEVDAFRTALARTVEYADDALGLHPELGYAPDSSALLGARLGAETQSRMGLTLEAGKKYVFLAKSSGDIDIDIVLHDEDGRIIARDVESDGMPVVVYEADRGGRYTIELRNASGRATYAVMAMLETGGARLAARFVRQTLTRLADAADGVSRGGFDERSGWSFFATLLHQGETHRFSGLPTHGRRGRVLMVADRDARDVELEVRGSDGAVQRDRSGRRRRRSVRLPAARSVTVRLRGVRVDAPSLVGALIVGAGGDPAARGPTEEAGPVATLRIFAAGARRASS